jgi:NADPH:quinone reductase-like Zn-dependent oxidoreductase
MPSTTLEIRSRISREGELRLWLEEVQLPRPRPNEIVVRVEAAPLNQALSLQAILAYSRRATGAKYLITPHTGTA